MSPAARAREGGGGVGRRWALKTWRTWAAGQGAGKGGGGVGGGGMGSAGGAGRGLCISDAGAKVEPQTSRIMPPRSSRCMQSAETAGNWMQETLTRLMH